MRFLEDSDTMKYVMGLSADPSDKNIWDTVDQIRKLLPNDGSVDAEIELIAMRLIQSIPGLRNVYEPL